MKRLFAIFTVTLALLTIDYASAADSTTADNTIDKTEITGRVSANDCHIITYDATKGEKIVVELYGDGDTDLALYVYDKDIKRIVDDELSDDGTYGWTAEYTGKYYIVVKNQGDVYNEFRMVIQ